MKTWILRFRARNRKNFEEIKHGLKTIETRATTERYRKIQAGDRLIFVCGSARLARKVKSVRRFASIGAMFRAVNYKKIMPSAESEGAARMVYYGYPWYKEKIRKFGVVAFWI